MPRKDGGLVPGGPGHLRRFPPSTGNNWSIINDKGQYFNRNVPDETHMICGHFTQIYGPLKVIAFDADGNGWSVVGAATLSETVGDEKGTVKIADIYANVQKKLDGRVVGYSCAIGRAIVGGYAHGEARTAADGGSRPFLPWTKAHVASVSKLITALATIRVVAAAAARGLRTKDGTLISLDSPIGEFLPKTWSIKAKVAAVPMRAFLSQRSGIKTADTRCDDPSLKALFEAAPTPGKFDPDDHGGFYSNCNFAIFRIVLPIFDGHDNYVTLCQKNVFDLMGAGAVVDCQPPPSWPQASAYAYQHQFPGSSPGANPGDLVSTSGGFGWYLTIEDMAKVLHSLNLNDGRILTPTQWADMTKFPPLGLDIFSDSRGYRWVEKNGGWNLGTTTMTTAAIFGAGVYGVLWMNSDME